MNFNYQNRSSSPFGGIASILFLVLLMVGLFYLFSAFTKFLYWASPFLLVAALVMRYKVVVNYAKMLGNLVRKMPLLGIGAILLTILLYPFVSLHLFLKALRKPIPEGARQQQQGPFFFEPRQEKSEETFTEFEDLTEEPIPKEKIENEDDDGYDQFFEL